MKKLLSLFLAVVMIFALAACGAEKAPQPGEAPEVSDEAAPAEAPAETQEETPAEAPADTEKAEVKVAVLKGPTALGALHMMDQAEKGELSENYQFTLAGAPDEILGSIIKGEFDIAAVPTNVASVLYNKTEGAVQLLALNTLGVLYCVENGDTVNSFADLNGKTVYCVGQGATPEYALKYLLTKNGLDPEKDVTIEFKAEAAEAAALLAEGEGIAVLPQPFVTAAMAKNENLRVAFDFNEEWAKLGENSAITMGCVVVQKKFAEENPAVVENFLKAYEESVNFTNSEETLPQAAELAVNYGIIPAAPIAQKAIPQCSIVFVAGDEMKSIAGEFLSILFDANPASVGGKLPEADFYYNAK